jgi:hypothetical protein
MTASSSYYLLYPRRYHRSARAKALSHLVPATLLVSGLLPLLKGEESLTPVLGLEIVVGAAYLVLMLRELWHLRHPTPHAEPVAWLELAAAGILALEGYHIWHRHHEHAVATGTHQVHILPWLYAAAAVMYTGVAFGSSRLSRRRYLHLLETGFAGRLRLLGPPFQFEWSQVQRVEAQEPAKLLVHSLHSAPKQLAFGHLLHGAQHRDRLLAHAQANLPLASPEA